ncbi:GABA permease [Peptococcaceae bacterium CEB3]|nr:GABA permease [Peptococcaceae bacterium CEB3]
MAERRSKKMSGFSLTMTALGSIIGAGMFLGAGLTLQAAGPSVLLAYALLGILMYFNLSFLAELSLLDPEEGSFQSYAGKAFGTGTGFVIGWLYWISGILTMSSEVTAAAIFSGRWFPAVPQWMFVIGFALALTVLNLIGAKGFGQAESALSIVKVIALLGFIILGVVLVFTPWLQPPTGWHNLTSAPFFPRGTTGFLGSLLLVFYAYSGTSVVGLAINQSKKPQKTVPNVVLATSILVTLLYVGSLFLLLLVHPWSVYNASASPYVLSLQSSRIPFALDIMNFVILTAALSAMNASMFGVSRMLHALADKGQAPKYFFRLNRKNVPLRALLFSNAFLLGVGILSYLIPNQLYLLVTGASGLLSLVNVVTIALAHWKLYPRLASRAKEEAHVFHVTGYPVTNALVGAIFILIFLSAFALPDQRPSFILGAALIILMGIVYFAVRTKLVPQAGRPSAGTAERNTETNRQNLRTEEGNQERNPGLHPVATATQETLQQGLEKKPFWFRRRKNRV